MSVDALETLPCKDLPPPVMRAVLKSRVFGAIAVRC